MKKSVLIVTINLLFICIMTNAYAKQINKNLQSKVDKLKADYGIAFNVNEFKEGWNKNNTYNLSFEFNNITKLKTSKDNFIKRKTSKKIVNTISSNGDLLELLYIENDKYPNILYMKYWLEHYAEKLVKLEINKWELIEQKDYQQGDYTYVKMHYYSKDKKAHKFTNLKISKNDVIYTIKTVFMYEEKIACTKMEAEAENTLNAIAAYFAEPSREKLPTLDQLKKEENLYTKFPVEIAWTDDSDIIVRVIDKNDECPKGSVYNAILLSGTRQWNN